MKREIVFISCSKHFGGAERILWYINEFISHKKLTRIIINIKQIQFYKKYNSRIVFTINWGAKISQNFFGVLYFFIKSIYLYFCLGSKKNFTFYCNDFESVVLASFPKIINPSNKIIWHIHDNYKFTKTRNRVIFKLINPFIYKYISLTTQSSCRLKKIVGCKVIVLNNFSRFEMSTPKKLQNESYYMLGYVGQITPWKGLDKIIQCVKVLNEKFSFNCRLKIIGRPYYADDHAFFHYVKQLSKDDKNIIWESHTDNLEGFYRNIDFLVSFSDNEPFGLVIVESMSQGTPVISFLGDGPLEIISSNYKDGVILNNKELMGLCTEINDFFKTLTQKNYYIKMSEASIKRVNSRFTKSSFENNLCLIVDEIL